MVTKVTYPSRRMLQGWFFEFKRTLYGFTFGYEKVGEESIWKCSKIA